MKHILNSMSCVFAVVLSATIAVLGCNFGKDVSDKPPTISEIRSSVFSDTDSVYSTGSMVRLDIEASSGEADIVSGTVRITSASTGYDSGVQPVTFGSIFYQWDTTGLVPADDYAVAVTLVDSAGQQSTANALIVKLAANPPAINKLVSHVDATFPSVGMPVHLVRTYLVDSGYNGSLGWGWTHSYLMHLAETADGLVKVFNGDGTGAFFHPDGQGAYVAPKGDFRVLTKKIDGTFALREKSGNLFQFDSSGVMVAIQDRNKNMTTLSYDERGLLAAITDASSQKTTLIYNGDNRVAAITDPAGRSVFYEYDGAGNLISFKGGDGFVTRYAYDDHHNLATMTDPLGRQTFFTINGDDRLERISLADGVNRKTFDYGVPKANQMTVTDALGHQTIFTFDTYGSVTEIIDPSGNKTQMAYDADLNMIRRTDASGNQETFTYDSTGNMTSAIDALGNTVTFTYDPVFHQIQSVVDASGNTTHLVYDENGNLMARGYPNGETETFSYDGHGNLLSLTDANGNAVLFDHNPLGRLTAMTYPDGTAETFGYDAFGNMVGKTDRMNQTIAYTYDPAGRIVGKSYPDHTSVTFDYDATGKMIAATDDNGTLTVEYDDWGRMATVIGGEGEIVSYGYDAAGNRTRLSYPDGMTLNYDYDALDRLIRIDESGQMVAGYTYDVLGRVIGRALQNGIASTYSYDASNHLMSLINRTSASDLVSSFAYTYDNAGNRLTMTTSEGTTRYFYDDGSQLVKVAYPNGATTSYTFDPAGNRTAEEIDGQRVDYTTNELNQYTDVNGDSYTYDANGNMTSKNTLLGTTTYAYDYENRLVQADTVTETITYTYDPFGRRTSKTTASGTTRYIHDGFRVIMEKDDGGHVEAAYIHGIGVDEVLVMDRGGERYFYSQDGLGSVAELTDSSENLVESYTYDAYGLPASASAVGNPYMFTGREFETETGMYYFRARYLNPELGRFITTDPIGLADDTNLYAYAKNNPVNKVDPSGLASGCPHCRGLWCAQLQWRCVFLCYLDPGLPGGSCWACKKKHQELCGNNGNNGGGGTGTHSGDPTFIQVPRMPAKEGVPSGSRGNNEKLVADLSIPYENSLVRAYVPIFGRACGNDFKSYRVEYGKGKNPSDWVPIHTSHIPQAGAVTDHDLDDSLDLTIYGNLATWDTGLKNYVYLPSHPKDHPIDLKGTYTIRLVVTGKDGAMVEDRVTVDVANVIPNAWGGTATSPDGRVVLTVPEQAIMDSFRLILIDKAQDGQIDKPSGRQVVGHIYKVKEPGERFTKAARIEMAYQKEGAKNLQPDQLGIYGFHAKKREWEYLKTVRDDKTGILFADVRKLHDDYAVMASETRGEGSCAKSMPAETAFGQKADAIPEDGHTLVRNTFEDGLGEWGNRDHEVGATVTRDTSVTFDDTHALKITNTHVGGNFAVNAVTTPYDASVYPVVQFDYRIPPGVKTDILVKVSGRWYDVGFTDDPKILKDKRVNIAHIGNIGEIEADDKWHTARFNLYDMLRTKTGHTRVETMIMADWDVNGYMKLAFGNNLKDATYYIDNFTIAKETTAGVRPSSHTLILDNFNQKKHTNTLGGRYSLFAEKENGLIDIDFTKNTPDGRGHALELRYDVSALGSYGGYSSDLQRLDLRGYQCLTFLVSADSGGKDCMIGIKDSAGNESKVKLSRYLSGGAVQHWQAVDIPLAAFTQIRDWGCIDNISFGFEYGMPPKGSVYLDDIAFHNTLTGLKIDDFEHRDQYNTLGKPHQTFVSGNAAVNGKYTQGSPNGIYRLSFGGNIGKINAYASDLKSFAAWRTELGGIDCSHCEHLTLRVRGAEGGENFTLYLGDGNFRWGVDIARYQTITTVWQTIDIPLSAFRDYGVDMTHIDDLEVVFEGHQMTGTVYLDDIYLGMAEKVATGN